MVGVREVTAGVTKGVSETPVIRDTWLEHVTETSEDDIPRVITY